jgi:hypothetical protein
MHSDRPNDHIMTDDDVQVQMPGEKMEGTEATMKYR